MTEIAGDGNRTGEQSRHRIVSLFDNVSEVNDVLLPMLTAASLTNILSLAIPIAAFFLQSASISLILL